jgi:hypothetical protein
LSQLLDGVARVLVDDFHLDLLPRLP